MIELSRAARDRIVAMFGEDDVAPAERLLECSADSPFLLSAVSRQGADRLLFAMIRLSDGSLERLRDAIALFRRDWRDLLVASEFARDIYAHEKWRPRRLQSETVKRWMAGDLPEGVKFGPGAPVEIRFRAPRGAGSVVGLAGLEPEPRYLVELPSGDRIEVRQFCLQDAASRGRGA
jgi:hypothetical protein